MINAHGFEVDPNDEHLGRPGRPAREAKAKGAFTAAELEALRQLAEEAARRD
jgi:hypothetical protein